MSEFDIDEFVSTVSQKGLMDPTRYIISVTSPIGPLEQDGSKYCCAATASGMSFDTTAHWIHGPIRNVAAHEKYSDEISLTFYNDYDMTEYNYFYRWMAEKIGGKQFYIEYYKDYIGDLVMLSYDREGSPRVKVNCSEVYPLSLTPFEFSYSKRESVPTFTVTFACHHVEISKP